MSVYCLYRILYGKSTTMFLLKKILVPSNLLSHSILFLSILLYNSIIFPSVVQQISILLLYFALFDDI